MNTFVQTVANLTRTDNGALTNKSSLNSTLDLFFTGGSLSMDEVLPKVQAALKEDKENALKVIFYLRDVRDGQGRRDVLRALVLELIKNDTRTLNKILPYIPEVGRWKDIFEHVNEYNKSTLEVLKGMMLDEKNTLSLMAKWMPREPKKEAKILADLIGLTPRQYRKFVVGNTKVVEQLMCAKKWGEIDFSKLPSVASKIYQEAFKKNCSESYEAFKNQLIKGETTVNSAVLYPHDIVSNLRRGIGDKVVLSSQWGSLPDYMDQSEKINILPIIDTSSSMTSLAYGNTSCMDVSIGLGVYIAERNRGEFKDVWCNFDSQPTFNKLVGDNITEKVENLDYENWGGSTNIEAVFNTMLNMATNHNIPKEDMPKVVLVVSDMEFDDCGDRTISHTIKDLYSYHGYDMPLVVFWNVGGSTSNSPLTKDEYGVSISGYSASIMKEILKSNFDKLTPYDFMMGVIQDKYKYLEGM